MKNIIKKGEVQTNKGNNIIKSKEDKNEITRIREAYRKRFSQKSNKYSFFRLGNLYLNQHREKDIIKSLVRFGIDDLSHAKILDLGCLIGNVLRDFIKYGADPQNCFGIDLLPYKIEKAKRISPNIDFICGNAEKLPYDNELFDIILCFTVFSSIFDEGMAKNISKEMVRVLKPTGIILWYDFFVDNYRNSDVRGIKKKEIIKLFSNCKVELKRITLAPFLSRAIAPYSWIFCYILEKLKILNTHYFGIIKKSNE